MLVPSRRWMPRLTILVSGLVSGLVWSLVLGVAVPAAGEARVPEQREDAPSRRAESGRPVAEASKRPVAGGQHWRIRSKNGPIHVWVPAGYDRATAGTVVYVHGYHVDVDQAWERHDLPQQFRKSQQNAMFVVPEAPRSNEDRVYWESLAELKQAVSRAGIRMPNGPTIAVAHSGGFRTIASWVDNRLLAQVILLDALYGRVEQFEQFIHSGKRAQHHKLLIVASHTAEQSRDFAKKFRYAAVRDRIPASYTEFTNREKRSKLFYLRSQYGHGQIVSGGKVIPLLLRITPLRRL
jgi:hypothetical protein